MYVKLQPKLDIMLKQYRNTNKQLNLFQVFVEAAKVLYKNYLKYKEEGFSDEESDEDNEKSKQKIDPKLTLNNRNIVKKKKCSC